MAQNANNEDGGSDKAADDSLEAHEAELRKELDSIEEVDDSQDQDEASETDDSENDAEDAGDDDGKTDDDSQEDEDSEDNEEESGYVKAHPNIKGDTLEEYARNMEATISESNKEGKRLSDEVADLKQQLADLKAGKKTDSSSDDEDDDLSNPQAIWARQKMDEEMRDAFEEIRKSYPQADDAVEYDKFRQKVGILSRTILESEKRYASPSELYNLAAVALKWKPQDQVDSKDKLSVAIKDRAATTKTTSATKKASKSKVTDAMIRLNRKMYPGKTDAQIRAELEPHIK